jgi:hypothetical protein
MRTKTNFWIFLLTLIAALIFANGCNDEDENGNGNDDEYGNPHYGNWIGIYDETFEGFEENECNAVFYNFSISDFMMYSFLDSDPAAGVKGLYSLNNDNEMVIYPDHVWSDETYDWDENAQDERILPLEFSSDEQTMTITTTFGDIEVQRCNQVNPEDLEGEWGLMEGDSIVASMNIEPTGGFSWEQDDQIQSGSVKKLGVVDGDNYLLFHITYCEFTTDGDADYYTVNKYSLNEAGDTFTLWHGNEEMELSFSQEEGEE